MASWSFWNGWNEKPSIWAGHAGSGVGRLANAHADTVKAANAARISRLDQFFMGTEAPYAPRSREASAILGGRRGRPGAPTVVVWRQGAVQNFQIRFSWTPSKDGVLAACSKSTQRAL